jgi:hypothetical protein
MKSAAENITEQSKYFFEQVDRVTQDYNWSKLSKQAIDGLIDRVGIKMFDRSKGYLKG